MADKVRTSRLTAYKNNNVGANELRRKRAELSVTLRKQARDEQLLKRRALSPDGDEEVAPIETLPEPKEIVQGLRSSDLTVLLSSARAARRMLSREQNPPISTLVSAGVVKPLVSALDHDDCGDLQFEAAWALTNIASGTHEHTLAVIDGGAIPKLVKVLGQGGVVGEQCVWALGNIAGDGAVPRDAVLSHGTLPALLPLLQPGVPLTQLRTAVWTYSNLCRNKNPLVDFKLVEPALPSISELMAHTDQDILSDACWSLSYLTDGPNDRIEAVQNTPRLLSRLLSLLGHKSVAVRTPALRAVGNMLTGDDEQTDRCVREGCIGPLKALLTCEKPALVKEAAWAFSNILAGTHSQIQAAIDQGALPLLIKVIQGEEARCQKEAAWSITNLCLGGSPQQLDALLKAGFLEPYCALLHSSDQKTVAVVLDGLCNVLQAAQRFGSVEVLAMQLEEIGAVDRLEQLQNHENEAIYTKVVQIIDTYFTDHEDASAVPAQTNEEFTFGTSQHNNIQF